MDDIEQLQSRLGNIQSVEPLLAALRTISLGSWNRTRKQITALAGYTRHLKTILSQLPGHLPDKMLTKGTYSKVGESNSQKTILLIVGSERGLCGSFNRGLLKPAANLREEHGNACEIWALGSRVVRYIEQEAWPLTWSTPISMMSLPPFQLVDEITHIWLDQFQSHKLEKVEVLFNRPGSGTSLQPTMVRLIPPSLFDIQPEGVSTSWPPPIVETNPRELFIHILEQFTLIRLYACLLESAAAEHAARFQLLEDATQNASRLKDELQQALNMARRQKITADMQALAAGVGSVR